MRNEKVRFFHGLKKWSKHFAETATYVEILRRREESVKNSRKCKDIADS